MGCVTRAIKESGGDTVLDSKAKSARTLLKVRREASAQSLSAGWSAETACGKGV